MTPRRVLIVTTARLEGAARERVLEQVGNGAAEIKIVAPAADVSPLEWLASDEDGARAEARQVAEQSVEAVEGQRVVAEVGDTDPLQAIEDALRTFSADEVIVVTHEGEDASWLEKDAGAAARERFGIPITHVPLD